MDKVIRVRSWQDFKSLAVRLEPESVVYNIEQNGLSPQRDLTCLRLIMPTQEAYYVFVDFPREDTLEKQVFQYGKTKKKTDT